MFSFLKKEPNGTKLSDVVWINEQQKFKGLVSIANANPNTIFLAWFDETCDKLNELLTQNAITTIICSAQSILPREAENKQVVFIEHYPLREKEENVYQKLGLENTIVHTALDEPLMKSFGSDKIIGLMKILGVKEDESFQHSMISSSIKNVQEKLKQKVSYEHPARSQADWLRQNILQ